MLHITAGARVVYHRWHGVRRAHALFAEVEGNSMSSGAGATAVGAGTGGEGGEGAGADASGMTLIEALQKWVGEHPDKVGEGAFCAFAP